MSVSHQLNDDLCVNGQWDAFLSSVMEKCEGGMQVLEKAISSKSWNVTLPFLSS